jgi:hypothetical protein
MAGAEGLRDVGIVLRPLVGVADHQLDRRAGGAPLVDARQDLDRIGLAPLGGVAVLPGAAAVEPGLDAASVSGTPGGQPSTVAPSAGPWLSPQVVTRNRWPKVLKLIETDTPPQRLWPFLRQYMGPFRRSSRRRAMSVIVAFVEVGLIWYMGRVVDLLEATGAPGFWAAHGWNWRWPRSSS